MTRCPEFRPRRGRAETAAARWPRALRRILAAAALAVMLIAGSHVPAHAQVVALVNGEPITALDVTQRMKLIQVSTHKVPSRKEALEELVNDKLKVQLSKRFIADVPKREIESTFATIARRAGMTPQQFTEALTRGGISVDSLKARIHADFVWSQIVRGKFQGSLQIGEKDVADALQTQKSNDAAGAGYEYTLRPILFIVPRGAPANTVEARKRDAEALRGRFQSCDEGLRVAMAMPDVAVRGAIVRASSDLPAQQREVLDKTPVGGLTPPDVTLQGVELFAVCRKEQSLSETPAKRELRDKMFAERYDAASKRYLNELRRAAMIEYR